jgi:hypothetical protein
MVRSDLYERLARMEKEGGAKAVELTSEMLRQGLLPQAQRAQDQAGSAVRDLKQGIERAAEKVVGDDTEALRLAQQQLDQLTQQIEREMGQGQGAATTNGQARATRPRSPPGQSIERNVAEQQATNQEGQAANYARGSLPVLGTSRTM